MLLMFKNSIKLKWINIYLNFYFSGENLPSDESDERIMTSQNRYMDVIDKKTRDNYRLLVSS